MPKPGRVHAPIDVNYWEDPVIESVSLKAAVLFQKMILAAFRLQTKGLVTRSAALRMAFDLDDPELLFGELIDVGLLEANREAKTYLIVSWFDWNSEANGKQTAKQRNGQKGGLASGIARRAAKQTEADDEAPAKHLLQALASQEERREEREERKESNKEKKEEREEKKEELPSTFASASSWVLSEQLRAWARENGLGRVDLDLEAQKMRDWARAKNTRRADWDATFRNWVRKAARDLPVSGGTSTAELNPELSMGWYDEVASR